MRSRRWGLLVTLLALCVQLVICARDPWARTPQGDGFYAWMFVRSIVYDGDIDFKNDYALCGDPFRVGVDRGTGHPNNNFSFGHAIFWIPALEITRVLVPVPSDAPKDIRLSCKGPRVSIVLYSSPIVGALTIFLAYLIARRFARDGAAALAAGLVGIAGTNLAYAGWMVSYSHIYASFAVTLLTWSTLRASEKTLAIDPKNSLAPWVLVAFAMALSILQRSTAIVFVVIPVAVAAHLFFRGAFDRKRFVAVLAILAGGVVVGSLPALLVNRYLFGSPWALPQGRYFLFPAHAHPWLVLFAPRGGLFYSAPTAWLGVFGIVMALRDPSRRIFFLAMTVAAAFEIFIASSALDWHESWGFGARRLTTLTPILVAGAAIVLERQRRWLVRRASRARSLLGAGILAGATLFAFGIVDGSAHNVIVPDSGHSQADFYGAGDRWFWELMDRNIGDLAILPAEIAFQLRYDLPMNAFRDATEPFAYARMQRGDLHFTADRFPLDDARMLTISNGLESTKGALHMTSSRARIVFAAEWPFATAYEVTTRGLRENHLRIGVGHAFGRVTWLERSEKPSANFGERKTHWAIPEGEFDSGINEIVIDGGSDVDISSFVILDEKIYPPAM
jgi:hypothetical protein